MRRGTAATVAAAALLLAGCGSSGSGSEAKGKDVFEKAADRTVCVKDATAISTYPTGFPRDFPFPPSTVVYNAQDRGQEGVVLTGVTTLPFKQVLAALNGKAQAAGFKVTSGETEEHDAEANWSGNGYRGRWAIRESGSCAGQTVVQVLATHG
jgi:hypothetical protein